MSRPRSSFSRRIGAWFGALLGVVVTASGQDVPPAEPSPVATVAPPPAPAGSIGDQITSAIRAVVEKARPAICRIEGKDEHGTLRGTGFFVDADGTLITSHSVGGQGEDFVVTVGEEKYPASRLAADPRTGLAILKVDAGEPLPFLRLGKSRDLGMASAVVALGYPFDLPLSPSFGLVAGFDLKFQSRYFTARHMRANLLVQRGQSGSPVFNLSGDVVGVVISTVQNESGAFALPVEAVSKVLHDLQQHGRIRPGWLGVSDVRRTEAPEFGSSARVRGLVADGPAHRGGVRVGDVLLQIGDRTIATWEDVLDASLYISAEEPLKIEVSRAGKRQTFTLTPTDRIDSEGPTVEHASTIPSTMPFGPK